MAELSVIGRPMFLRKEIDSTHGHVDKMFRKGMKIIDIVPVDFNMNLNNLVTENASNYMINYDFTTPMKNYKKLQKNYKLEEQTDGLRIYTTDETVMSEEFSNNFSPNKVSEMINSLSTGSLATTARDLARSFGGSNVISESGKAIREATNEAAGGIIDKAISATPDFAQKGLKIAGNVIAEGKHISLPKIWRESNYTPSLSLSVRLVSPYGSPASIKKHVIEPLIRLNLLTCPTSTDGVTYGKSPYVYVNAYGITNISIGYVESVSIRRGGDDVTYNQWRQPLFIDVAISIKPAMDGFAAIDGLKTVADMDLAEDKFEGGGFMNPGPGFTTVGNIINSLRPMPIEDKGESLIEKAFSNSSNSNIVSIPDEKSITLSDNVKATKEAAVEVAQKAVADAQATLAAAQKAAQEAGDE
jgi:hypothetical protein